MRWTDSAVYALMEACDKLVENIHEWAEKYPDMKSKLYSVIREKDCELPLVALTRQIIECALYEDCKAIIERRNLRRAVRRAEGPISNSIGPPRMVGAVQMRVLEKHVLSRNGK